MNHFENDRVLSFKDKMKTNELNLKCSLRQLSYRELCPNQGRGHPGPLVHSRTRTSWASREKERYSEQMVLVVLEKVINPIASIKNDKSVLRTILRPHITGSSNFATLDHKPHIVQLGLYQQTSA